MQKTLWALVASTAVLAGGAAASYAQGPGSMTPSDRPGSMPQRGDGPSQRDARSDEQRPGMMMGRGGGHGMMGSDMQHRGGRHMGCMGPGMMTMMMIMMDTNADRALSLEEVQAVHSRIFKYADEDDDGKLTMEELRKFFHGGGFDSDDD
jgi:hypothetical protein